MIRLAALLATLVLAAGCIRVKMDPIQVHATVDVNVRVEKALEDVFGDLDRKAAELSRTTP